VITSVQAIEHFLVIFFSVFPLPCGPCFPWLEAFFDRWKDIDRRSSDVGSAGKHGAGPGEMLLPDILAGVEKSRQQTCIAVETCDIRPLVVVVIQARQRQVFGDGRSGNPDTREFVAIPGCLGKS
jgi:hypothetical protein